MCIATRSFCFSIFSTLTDWWCLENSWQLKIFNPSPWFCLCAPMDSWNYPENKVKGMIQVCSKCSYPFCQVQGKGPRSHLGLWGPKLFSSYHLSDKAPASLPPSPLAPSHSRHRTVSGSLLPGRPFPQCVCVSPMTSSRSLHKYHLAEDFPYPLSLVF